jgi:hypothetical protein
LKWLLSIDLKVVIDENTQISAGIITYGQKKYSPAGANYTTLRSFDPALNWITGRKQMLKVNIRTSI